MKIKLYLGLLLRIIILFVTMGLSTYITPLMRDFFGDTLLDKPNLFSTIDSNYKWGSRHYIFKKTKFC